ncbi:MAG: ATP-binding protein [Bacteroidia bacterium]
MKTIRLSKTGKAKQYIISFAVIIATAVICSLLSAFIEYRVVALLLLVVVSLIAMFFDILPVLLSAFLSALVWNFFFIPPKFTFTIGSTEDALMFIMYFFIAMVNAVLTHKIRTMEKEASRRQEKENTLRLYNTLLNSLSHELRTPISTIIGAADNLQENSVKLSEKHKAELVSEISKASLRLNRQVENLLNMSRLESGVIKPKKDWSDVNELVYDAVHNLQENSKVAQQISINIDPEIPLFKIDKVMIGQIVNNLLYNAILYTPENSIIEITAACHIDVLQIIVEDNGKGFPPEEIEKVFEKFYRLTHSKVGGTGLGLSIVRGFAEAHDGSVRLENKKEGGAKFTIEIPAETSYIKNLKNE